VTISRNVGRGSAAVIAALSVVVILAGCGGDVASSSSPVPSPTASASGGGLVGQVGAFKAYLDQVTPVMSQLGTTVASLPDAVKGVSAEPGSSWTTAAGKLDSIGTQLGNEADSLAALTPPSALAPVQDAAVKGIRDARSAVSKTAAALDTRATTSATNQTALEAQIAALRAELSLLSKGLLGAVQGLVGSRAGSPTP
jgi:hypothetical protein